MRVGNKSLLFGIAKASGVFYISPSNFNYGYNFGVLALYFLVSQIITGIFLAMFYNASTSFAFTSIININNEIYFGWGIRALHSNGASGFFLIVYIHMAKGIYYASYGYPRQMLGISGVLIGVLMIATAFLGYVLPGGQMSFGGAMVITSLLGAIPLVGNDILFLLGGGYSIDNITIYRFYSLHYTLPFVILVVALLHLFFLHEFGSSNPLGVVSKFDNIPLFPYYSLKDFFSIVLVWGVFFYIIFVAPDWLGHPDNYILANPLVTPAHIVPEGYFLPLYAVLRSVTDKLLGIALIGLFIACLFFMPFFLKGMLFRSGTFRPGYAFIFWGFLLSCLLLGGLGSLPVMYPYLVVGQFTTAAYFIFVLVLFPLNSHIERLVYHAYALRMSRRFLTK